MLKIHLTFELDVSFGVSRNQKTKVKKIKLSQEKSDLKQEITSKPPEYIHNIQSVYYLERRCFW